MAEHPAVNRRVVSSNLTCGAKISNWGGLRASPVFVVGQCRTTQMFWVYVLENVVGKFYVGQTANLDVRVEDHNRTDCFDGHYTRKNGPWTLVWSEAHESRSSAVRRERQIKSMKSAKWIRAQLLGR